jgi:hypothetical protein
VILEMFIIIIIIIIIMFFAVAACDSVGCLILLPWRGTV